MKWNWYTRRFGHLYPPLRSFGGGESNFCMDTHEWVEVSQICVHCPRYRRWDGANLDCEYHFKWEKQVDENFRRAAELEEDSDIMIQQWGPEEKDEAEIEEGQKDETWDLTPEQEIMRAQVGAARDVDVQNENHERDEDENWEELQSDRQGIMGMWKKIKDGIFGENEEDEEEDDEDEDEEETY